MVLKLAPVRVPGLRHLKVRTARRQRHFSQLSSAQKSRPPGSPRRTIKFSFFTLPHPPGFEFLRQVTARDPFSHGRFVEFDPPLQAVLDLLNSDSLVFQ